MIDHEAEITCKIASGPFIAQRARVNIVSVDVCVKRAGERLATIAHASCSVDLDGRTLGVFIDVYGYRFDLHALGIDVYPNDVNVGPMPDHARLAAHEACRLAAERLGEVAETCDAWGRRWIKPAAHTLATRADLF